MTSSGCFRTNFPTTAATFTASPEPGISAARFSPARDPPAEVVDVGVVVGTPLAEDGAEQELPAHRERVEPILVDQRVVVGIVPFLIIGVAVTVGYSGQI